ncbi:hypothetical protein GLOTRDRAFT_120575 [Gloeophyllum trabeum ATCC 11539]|uniref:DUF7082 domain-containing protein n=1 Tax=Gloeophyllum trabeum (strain ATCC 11539 / FP-39264 / Madison 617) TaxID=670483 RepID=S7RRV2_GLOTA|nr:uncharacterized protein GLOTRDRAFT_120575 [Gloeophyllum trabeum ATCC 11539]EPQ57370.1 hypothetical protein GLOTRDRAFT_120575 [Gloeophyllum trabeum ATCC 11539]
MGPYRRSNHGTQVTANTMVPVRYISTIEYSPTFGLTGTDFRARVHYCPPAGSAKEVCLRLVFGTKPVKTDLMQIEGSIFDLTAKVPDQPCPMGRVILLVQSVTKKKEVLETAVLGSFTYNEHGVHATSLGASAPEEQRYSGGNAPTTNNATRNSSPASDRSSSSRRTRTRRVRSKSSPATAAKMQALVRTRVSAAPPSYGGCIAKKAVIEVLTPLDAMAEDWRESEKQVGRRLIRFHVQRREHILKVSCEKIEQAEYDERDTVVSCIYRTESGVCYITSVDIIYLLERIVGTVFKVEEKNRIRRNLEGLKPITTGKGKKWCGDFFQKIMDFPNPKPRTIEKDLKVFEWRVLRQALEKIISRYSLYTSATDHSAPQTYGTDTRASGSPEFESEPLGDLVYPQSLDTMGIPPSVITALTPPRSHSLSPAFAPDVAMADRESSGSSGSSPMLSSSPLYQATAGATVGGWATEPSMHGYNIVHPGLYVPAPFADEAYSANAGIIDDFTTHTTFDYRMPYAVPTSQYYM